MDLSRRRWLFRSVFYGVPLGCFAYGSLFERRHLTLTRQEIPLPSTATHLEGITIAVMSDFHHDDFGDNRLIREAVDRINEEPIDVVVLCGDYITDDVSALEPLTHELSRLRAERGVHAILGNHDRWHYDPAIPRLLDEAGVRLLVNESAEFNDFALAGIDSCWGGLPSIPAATASLPSDKPVILARHEPDTFDRCEDERVILQVSGHTHGGQVLAPIHGPIILPRYGKKYPYGHYHQEGRSLFVTRGVGTMDIPARFLCPPEIAMLTLTA